MAAAETPDWQPKFLDLWPTLLIRRRLTGHDGPNAQLVDLVERMDGESEQLTSRYQGVDFLAIDNPAVRWLQGGVEETIRAYFGESGMDYPIRWSLQSWPNINRRGDYHPPHNHAWCYLSGTYYVKMAGDGSGAISFYDPRSTVGHAQHHSAVTVGIAFQEPDDFRSGLPQGVDQHQRVPARANNDLGTHVTHGSISSFAV